MAAPSLGEISMKYDPDLSPKSPEEQQESSKQEETSLGITQNMAGMLIYILGWVSGIAFLLFEKENKFVRFHTMQSIVIFVPLTIISFIAGFVPFIGGFISAVCGIAGVLIWLFMMYQAFNGRQYKFPIAGDYAETQLVNIGTK